MQHSYRVNGYENSYIYIAASFMNFSTWTQYFEWCFSIFNMLSVRYTLKEIICMYTRILYSGALRGDQSMSMSKETCHLHFVLVF